MTMRYVFVFLWSALLCFLLLGCEKDRARAQAAADARAGIAAAVQVAPAAAPILAGVDARLPAASGVNTAEWPAPTITPEAIIADPAAYTNTAPPEPSRASLWAMLATGGTALLWLIGRVAPGIPGLGPLAGSLADSAWAVLAHRNQKRADTAREIVHGAATHLQPIVSLLLEARPDTLPEPLRNLIGVDSIRRALAQVNVWSEPARTTPDAET